VRMKEGCLDLTVFQDGKPLITYFLFPRAKLAFRKFRNGAKKGVIEEVEYNFAFQLCKELCKFRNGGRRVEGTFVQWLKSKQQKQKRRGKEDVMSVLFREGKIELSGLVFVRR